MHARVDFRTSLIEKLCAFIEKPEGRTKDEISSIQVFLTQLFVLNECKYIDFSTKETHNWDRFDRFAYEEMSRRMIPDDTEPMKPFGILQLLGG